MIDPETLNNKDKDLRNFRLILLISVVIHFVMGFIRHYAEPAIIDPISIRIIGSAYGLAIYILSFTSNFFRKNLRTFGYVLAYIISLNVYYVIIVNHFIPSYVMGAFLVFFGVCIVFQRSTALIAYIIFMVITTVVSSYLVTEPQTNPVVFTSNFICMAIIIYLALRSKIKNKEELENLNTLLTKEITEKEEAEHKIRLLNTHLEDNIKELEVVNHDLEAFTYSVSHDLRTPLRNSHLIVDRLRRKYGESFNAEGNEMLENLYNNTTSMDTLINDLLSFSLLGKHQIKKFTIDMTELAKDVLAEYTKSDAEMMNVVTIHPLLVARGDYSLLQQVFINLLSNAFKYTAKKDDRKIELGSELGHGENIYYVKDNGVGFDMEYRNKLFEVFQRLHSKNDFEGFGVGLAIVKRVVDKHGGRVWAESEEGRGATFYFSIPDEN